MSTPLTRGVHHIGLTVPDLHASAAFFTSLLGWQEVRRDDSYPAIFVSDGSIMLTLWQTRSATPSAFDKDRNTGLHHLALKVDSEQTLEEVHRIMQGVAGVAIEFAPELLRDGPAKHMMCFEPSGIRVEFIWPGS